MYTVICDRCGKDASEDGVTQSDSSVNNAKEADVPKASKVKESEVNANIQRLIS